MPNIYEQMLMGDATDQAKMKMAAAALRRRERFGTLAAMTGDKMLAPWGQAQLEDIQSKAGKMMTAGQQGRQVAEQRAAREQRESAAVRSHGLDKAKQAWAEEKFGQTTAERLREYEFDLAEAERDAAEFGVTSGLQSRQIDEQGAARDQRESAAVRSHGLDKAKQAWAEEKFGRQPYMGPAGNVYTEGEGWVDPPENIAEQKELDRQAKIDAAAAGRSHGLSSWYAKEEYKTQLPTRGDAAKARKTLSYLPELKDLAAGFLGQGIEIPPMPEAMANAVRSIPFGESLAPLIEREGMSTEAVQWLERGRQMESDIMRLASGLAVTGFELENIKKWSPWSANLTPKQRVDRTKNIYNKMGREAASVTKDAWENADFSNEFLGVTPPVPGAPPAPEAPPAAETGGLPVGWSVKVR